MLFAWLGKAYGANRIVFLVASLKYNIVPQHRPVIKPPFLGAPKLHRPTMLRNTDLEGRAASRYALHPASQAVDGGNLAPLRVPKIRIRIPGVLAYGAFLGIQVPSILLTR